MFRDEFNAMLKRNADVGRSDRILEHYFTFKVRASSAREASEQLAHIEQETTEALARIGSVARRLSGIERLGLLNNIFYPKEPFFFSYDALLHSSLRTKDAIAPMAITVPKAPANVVQYGDTYGRCLTLTAKTGWPSDMSDRLIAELGVLDTDMVISFHLRPEAQDKALQMVAAKYVAMASERDARRRAAKNKSHLLDPDDNVPFELKDRLADIEELRQDMKSRNLKMFYGTFLVYLYASSIDELDLATRQVKSAAYKLMYRLDAIETARPLIDALNSVLPLGKCHIDIRRTLMTTNAAAMIPFASLQLQQPGGLYYGVERLSKRYLTFDRMSLRAPHGMYLGSTGSGKSFAVKREIVQILMRRPAAEIWISDPDNEYVDFVELMGGDYIEVQPDSPCYINLMDIVPEPDGRWPIAKKSQFLMGVAESIYPLTGAEVAILRSVVDRCVIGLYEPYIQGSIRTMPTFGDLLGLLKEQPEETAQNLATAFEGYSSGTMRQFGSLTTVDFSARRLHALGMRETGDVFRGLAQHVIVDMLWQRLLVNHARGVETWIYFDEFQTSLKSRQQAEFFLDLWARARKLSGIATAITQNPNTILDHEDARKALANSPFVALFDVPDPDGIGELFKLSTKQMEYLSHPQPGSGLYRIGEIIVAFSDDFPRDTELYRVMTTKPDEAKRR
jgi:hypothetical protein